MGTNMESPDMIASLEIRRIAEQVKDGQTENEPENGHLHAHDIDSHTWC